MKLSPKHYARALTRVVDEKSSIKILRGLKAIQKIVKTLGIEKYWLDPNINLDKKLEITQEIVKSFDGDHKLANFMNIIITNQSVRNLSKIISAYEREVQKQGYMLGAIVSAKPLSSDEVSSYQKLAESKFDKKIVLKNVIDSQVLGGVKLYIGDEFFDSTTSGFLSQISQEIQK